MSLPAINLIGQQFGRLTVLERAGSDRRKGALWLCQCSCTANNRVIVRSDILRSGASKSCGCWHKNAVTKHGGVGTIEYKTYGEMLQRCHNANGKDFPNYGGRGIEVCKRWRFGEGDKSGFECFRDDVGEKPSPDHVIDRVDNDKGYSPDNCRWATRILSMNNQRNRRNKFGVPGVLASGNKYTAHIKTMGKTTCLGMFNTPEEASVAYQKAKNNKIKKLEALL